MQLLITFGVIALFSLYCESDRAPISYSEQEQRQSLTLVEFTLYADPITNALCTDTIASEQDLEQADSYGYGYNFGLGRRSMEETTAPTQQEEQTFCVECIAV